jgi:transposase
VEVIVGTEMMMVQLRSLPLHEKWSLLHHPRRTFGCAGHNRIKACVTMILWYASNKEVSVSIVIIK